MTLVTLVYFGFLSCTTRISKPENQFLPVQIILVFTSKGWSSKWAVDDKKLSVSFFVAKLTFMVNLFFATTEFEAITFIVHMTTWTRSKLDDIFLTLKTEHAKTYYHPRIV